MRRRTVIALCIAVVLALGGVVVWRMMQQHPTVKAARDAAESLAEAMGDSGETAVDVNLTMRSIELTHAVQGQLRWKLSATNARYLQDESAVEVDEPHILYYTGVGNGTSSQQNALDVRADRGRVEQENQTAVLTENVRADMPQGRITAERLDYLGKERVLLLQGDVTFVGEFNSTAPTLRVNLENRDLRASGGVEAVFQLSGAENGVE